MEITGKTQITLVLNADMVNIVLASLSAKPYGEVAGLINLIQQQIQVQFKAPESVPAVQEEMETQ